MSQGVYDFQFSSLNENDHYKQNDQEEEIKDLLYENSKLTFKEGQQLLQLFAARHKLNLITRKNLLQLLNCFLPESQQLSSSWTQLQNEQEDFEKTRYYLFNFIIKFY